MNKKMYLATFLMVLLCLSGCGDNNAVTSDADSVEEVISGQSDEISDVVVPPEPAEEESVEADDETVDDDNETPELNEAESTDETKLEEIRYISSKLVDTENTVTETVADTNASESVHADTNTNESAPVTTTAQASIGETKTFSNGVTFVARGQTPGGLPIWYLESDNSTWPDYMIAAYDAVGITNDMSDYDKAVAINNYVCSVVDYAYENGVDDRAAYCACLSYGKAICTGYSHAFDALCTMAGVYGNQVVGTLTANNATHAWNYVLIDDTKYWVDSTLNDSNNNAYLMSTTQFSDHVFGYEK